MKKRPDSLDSALRRSGRFDREISMGIPDALSREEILKNLTNQIKISSDISIKELSIKTPGYVGADLQSLV